MSTKKRGFSRYIKGPGKFLARARDLYVRSLTGCAGNVGYGSAAGPSLQFSSMPRSFSANSSNSAYTAREEDLRELIRLASTRSLTAKVEAELRRSSPMGAGGVPRSRTVAIGRIDEEEPYEFGNDAVAVRTEALPRSRSDAPYARNVTV